MDSKFKESMKWWKSPTEIISLKKYNFPASTQADKTKSTNVLFSNCYVFDSKVEETHESNLLEYFLERFIFLDNDGHGISTSTYCTRASCKINARYYFYLCVLTVFFCVFNCFACLDWIYFVIFRNASYNRGT